MSDTDTAHFRRATYVVSDLDRALILYRDILGLDVEFMHDGRTGREVGIVDDDGNVVLAYRIETPVP